jgi:hypothetical protein
MAASSRGMQLIPVNATLDIQIGDDVVVRKSNPPTLHDDTGKLLNLTAVEITQLKGADPLSRGYPAEFADLQIGQTLKFFVATKDANGPSSDQVPSKRGQSRPDELTGTLTRVNRSFRKLTVRFQSLAVPGSARQQQSMSKTALEGLLAERKVTMILLLSREPAAK